MLVNEQRLEQALQFLAETDFEYAQWKSMVLRSEYMSEVAEDMVYLALTDGTVEERKRKANVSDEHRKAQEEHFQAVAKFENLRAQRQRHIHVIDIYRTQEASRRVGNIT